MNNNNLNNNLEFLDFINVMGFTSQLRNTYLSNLQAQHINGAISQFFNEIQKLHLENSIIIEQNNEIIKLLKEKNNKKGDI